MSSPPPEPLPKKGMSGCLLAFLIVAGSLALIVIAGAVIAYRFAQSDEGQKIFGAVKEATAMAAEAMQAPGTKELRELGCDQAMVMDVTRMTAFAGEMATARGEAAGEDLRYLVTCHLGIFSDRMLACDQVAARYVEAVGKRDERFSVSVMRRSGQAACVTLYAPDGTRVADLEAE